MTRSLTLTAPITGPSIDYFDVSPSSVEQGDSFDWSGSASAGSANITAYRAYVVGSQGGSWASSDSSSVSFSGSVGTGENPYSFYNGTGWYTLEFDVSDANGNSDSATQSIYVAQPTVWGCTDSSAINFDPNANTDDGSCEYNAGCTTPGYDNYDSSATVSDGSCACATGRYWNGSSCVANTIYGCRTSGYDNYDPSATADGTCSCTGSREWNGSACEDTKTCWNGTVVLVSDSCPVQCASDQGSTCYSSTNDCGQSNAGTVQCDGSCSATSAPADPSYYGQTCTATNACGQSNTGTYDCNDNCSASAPAVPGSSSCTAKNSCGQVGYGSTDQCGNGCSAVAPSDSGCPSTGGGGGSSECVPSCASNGGCGESDGCGGTCGTVCDAGCPDAESPACGGNPCGPCEVYTDTGGGSYVDPNTGQTVTTSSSYECVTDCEACPDQCYNWCDCGNGNFPSIPPGGDCQSACSSGSGS
jgi:hypothetical protein